MTEQTPPPGVVYDDADEFSRALGDTEEEIAEAKRLADVLFPPDDPEQNKQ